MDLMKSDGTENDGKTCPVMLEVWFPTEIHKIFESLQILWDFS